MSDLNKHLKLFNFYATESDKNSKGYENNISRALAICLKNEAILLNEFLREVLNKRDYNEMFEKIFNNTETERGIEVNIQQKSSEIDCQYVYGLTLTPEETSNEKFEQIETNTKEDPIPDIVILVRDIAIVIEVKKNKEERGVAQLKNQVRTIVENCELPFKNIQNESSYTWEKIIMLFLRVQNYLNMMNKKENVFIDDFLDYIKTEYPRWFPIKPLSKINFTTNQSNSNFVQLKKRLEIIKSHVSNLLNDKESFQQTAGRGDIPLDVDWAQIAEIKPEKREGSQYLVLKVWPGDTKGQGKNLFKKDRKLAWTNQKQIKDKYRLEITPYIKFAHFNKGICYININSKERKKLGTHDLEGFLQLAGRWKKDAATDNWFKLENILDKKLDFNWQTETNWEEKFKQSNRSYVDISLGYKVEVLIPYAEASTKDKNRKDDCPEIAQFIFQLLEELKLLIEA